MYEALNMTKYSHFKRNTEKQTVCMIEISINKVKNGGKVVGCSEFVAEEIVVRI